MASRQRKPITRIIAGLGILAGCHRGLAEVIVYIHWSPCLNTRTTPPVGYVTLVRTNSNYRNIWFGEIVSLFGDWFNLIASAALISRLTGSGVAGGGVFVVCMPVPLPFRPFGGGLARPCERRHLLMGADV